MSDGPEAARGEARGGGLPHVTLDILYLGLPLAGTAAVAPTPKMVIKEHAWFTITPEVLR